MASTISYQDILQKEYSRRYARNPGYSLRAFARDIGLAPPKLSAAMNGKGGFSPVVAKQIAQKLRLPRQEQKLFIALVASRHARSAKIRAEAMKESEKLLENVMDYIDLNTYRIVKDWYHYAILELFYVKDFRPDPKWIAGRLRITEALVRDAIQRLLDCKMLERDEQGVLRLAMHDVMLKSVPPNGPERTEHTTQLLHKFLKGRTEFGAEEYGHFAMTLAIPESRLPQILEELTEMRWKIAKASQIPGEMNRVYAFTIQLFPLDKKEST